MNLGAQSPLSLTLTEATSLLAQLPSILFPVLLFVILALISLILWFIWRRPSPTSTLTEIPTDQLPERLSASTRPLLLSEEASLFNMVRLAVQDSYLVFAKLPLSTVLTIDETDRNIRKAIMKSIQHVRLDIALIHPGTLQLSKAIRFNTGETSADPSVKKEQVVATILESAGIETVDLETDVHYSVPQLIGLLGLAEED